MDRWMEATFQATFDGGRGQAASNKPGVGKGRWMHEQNISQHECRSN